MLRLIAAITLAFISSAHADPIITCEDVKAKVAEVGKREAIHYARAHGASWKQIAEAVKCFGK